MTDVDIEKVEVHEIEISSSNDEIFLENDKVEITLKIKKEKDKKEEIYITKIVVTSKAGNSTVFDNKKNPIKASASQPIEEKNRERVVVWDLPDNSYYIKSITRYKTAGGASVYTFHWENPSLVYGIANFFIFIFNFFGGSLSGKSGSGGGLQK